MLIAVYGVENNACTVQYKTNVETYIETKDIENLIVSHSCLAQSKSCKRLHFLIQIILIHYVKNQFLGDEIACWRNYSEFPAYIIYGITN